MTRLLRFAAPLLLAACDSGGGMNGLPDPGPCQAAITAYPLDPGEHVPVGDPIAWRSNPPSSGKHYPIWAAWSRVYTQPVPRGHWVHNLEHGGVALLDNCPAGCPDVVSGLAAFAQGIQADPLCGPPLRARWLVTPDPLLPEGVQVAAASWGFTYTARCLDPATLGIFVQQHYGRGTETTCADGMAFP